MTPPSHRRRSRFEALVGDQPLLPLVVLFLLFLMDEFDTAAVTVLGPNLKHVFGLSDSSIILLAVVGLTVVLAFAVPVGHLGDRLPRRSIALAGAVLAAACSLLTGLAPVVGVLVAARIGNGIGKLMNESVHPSLLSDYYRPTQRPGVFAAHRSAAFVGAIGGAATAGLLGALFNWRVAFVVLVVPMAATVFIGVTRLREPLRGASDDPDAARDVADEDPPSFGEARRILFAVPTLRRQYLASFFLGAATTPQAILVPLLLHEELGLGELGRGVVGALFAAATMGGVLVGGRLAARWAVEAPGRLVSRGGIALVLAGLGLGAFALSPTVAVALPVGVLTAAGFGFTFPGPTAATSLVAPARVRTLAFSFNAVFLVAGVWVLYFLSGIAAVADDHGPRVGLLAVVPFFVVAGLVLRSAHRFVAPDAATGAASLALTAQLRAERVAAAAGEAPLLACRQVTAGYDGVQVLFGVDLEVRPGECVALLGTNGAGKSTLLRAISGTLDPTGGLVAFDGVDVTHADGNQTARLGIAHVPGGRAVFPTLSVDEHLRAAGWLYRRDTARLNTATHEVFAVFPALRERRDQLAGNLSGGEQQMLAIGMAFVARPRLLMIDELSLGLAPAVVEQLLVMVRRMQAAGCAVLLVEQSLAVALSVADRAYFLEKGTVRFAGATRDLLDRDDLARAVFLPAAPGPATPSATARAGAGPATPALDVDTVSVRFGGVRAVDRASFQVAPGEVVGLIGANGAGKTTVMDLVSGFVAPDRGRIRLGGIDVTGQSPAQRARRGLGRSFQDARLVGSLTVSEVLALGFERHIEVRDHFASLVRLPAVLDAEDDVRRSVDDLIELLSLGDHRGRFVGELSTGTRRVVDLAMCLAHRPHLLLLDEPSSGLAQPEAEALVPLLRSIRDDTGCALLVVEHDIPLVSAVADRLIALELGRPIASGAPAEVVADPRVIESYLGGDPAAIHRSRTVEHVL